MVDVSNNVVIETLVKLAIADKNATSSLPLFLSWLEIDNGPSE